jgi:hypothetical protein
LVIPRGWTDRNPGNRIGTGSHLVLLMVGGGGFSTCHPPPISIPKHRIWEYNNRRTMTK